jgi:predicted O-methyltransferase YrrM
MSSGCIAITAADAKYFGLAQGCIQSLLDKREDRPVALGFLDLGCTPDQRAWLQTKVDCIQQPDWEFAFPDRNNQPGYFKGLLARPLLRRYFPDHEVYLWIDADAWVENWAAVDLFVRGARRRQGLAIVPEINLSGQFQGGQVPEGWVKLQHWYGMLYDTETAKHLATLPLLNAGVFALHRDAPHWQIWKDTLGEGLQKWCSILTDQLALNEAVYWRGLLRRTELLPAWCNWGWHFGLPCWDEKRACLVEPYLPHTPIAIMHLTWLKHERACLQTTGGQGMEVRMRYPASLVQATASAAPESLSLPEETDYVSPGLETVNPDRFFPHLTVGDKSICRWPFVRRQIPHRWYVDRRAPLVGLVTRDEAHLLYNAALSLRGQSALEIGCRLGWSACHLALGGVHLDVIDPILERREYYAGVVSSLRSAGVLHNVNFFPGQSPQKIRELGLQGHRKWSLFFIDGNHEAPQALEDAQACETFAAETALMLFHDLACPRMALGLDYLQDKGWNTMVHQTMNIMGVAWRGSVEPLKHIPDPAVQWPFPSHLHRHPISY